MLFLENKDCGEDVLRQIGMISHEGPYLRYLLIWLPMTGKRLNPLVFPPARTDSVSEERVKVCVVGSSLGQGQSNHRRDRGQSVLLHCGASVMRR